MDTCSRCGTSISGKSARYGDELLCKNCLIEESQTGNVCPCCGTHISADADSVGLLLARPGASSQEKSQAQSVLAVVCPYCHILFMDTFQFNLLSEMKRG